MARSRRERFRTLTITDRLDEEIAQRFALAMNASRALLEAVGMHAACVHP
jgi:hypothetical protein